MTFEPMPSIAAPMRVSMRARSCTCGSDAALRITLEPDVSAAAIRAFSVAHHGRLVHEEVAGPQAAVRRGQADVAVDAHVGAERAEGVEVRVQPAAPDHVAARRRQQRGAEAREQRAADEHGGADALGQVGVDVGGADGIGLERDGVAVAALHLHAEVLEQRDERLGVADPRHVVQHHRLVRQEARRQQRQGRVLVAGGHDGAGQRHAAFDDELLHEGWKRSIATDVGLPRKLG